MTATPLPGGRYIVLGRAANVPHDMVGRVVLVNSRALEFPEITVHSQDENGDIRGQLDGKAIVGQWSRVLDNDQALTLDMWWWRNE